ncbi:MAG: hypothetical protein ACU837_14020 [Gammaproteobacteria bacterium]
MSNIKFPLRLIARLDIHSGLSYGRRGAGRVVAEGFYRFGRNAFAEAQVKLIGDADGRASASAQLCQSALQGMHCRLQDDPAFKDIAKRLAECELAVVFTEGQAHLLELDRSGTLLIACDLAIPCDDAAIHGRDASSTSQTELRQGFECLLLLGHWHLFICREGRTYRQALAKVVELYAAFSAFERACIHSVLEGNLLDSGNLFSIFLKRASGDFAAEIEARQQPFWVDRQITWLFGQDRVDLPYQRQAALAILHSEADADERRLRLYQLLRGYDKQIERENIARIASEVREAGQQLIFGRMSRAFHNQAMLFANAVLLQPGTSWRQFAAELTALAADAPDLQSTAEALTLLLASTAEIPLTSLEGASERFEDALLDAQKTALSNTLAVSRERVENHNDAVLDPYEPLVSHEAIMSRTVQGLRLIERIREAALRTAQRHAAYVVISQRPSPTGSHLLVKSNEFLDPYAGKAENLRKLVRLGGDRIYCSPDYAWLAVADHWIEAIPLFIKEEVLVQDGRESTRTVIDISGMEVSFREEMADLWAVNIRQVLESELLCVARECVAGEKFPGLGEEALRQRLREQSDPGEIAAVGVLLYDIYRREIDRVQKLIEAEALVPFDALRQILLASEALRQLVEHRQNSGSWTASAQAILHSCGFSKDFKRDVSRFIPQALMPRRALPTLHVLTTQSAGMTDGYIRTWLEESMALFNIAEDLCLHEKIAEREAFFTARILNLGEKVIRELGVWVEVEELCAAEQIAQAAAVLRVVNRHRLVEDELSCLGTLLEFQEMLQGRKKAEECDDPNEVEDYLSRNAEALQESALNQVIARNREALMGRLDGEDSEAALRRLVLEDDYYRQDLAAYARHTARRRVLQALHAEHPQYRLSERSASYLRRFRQLRKTTARKQIIAENALNALTLHPLYYFKASGGGKRYHLLYTPSRVDLGARERESVETWSQWVGGADRAAALAGQALYSLINKDVRVFDSLTEPELLKTGENASMASHFAFSNALGMMVTAVAHGDLETMADLMNRRCDRLVHPAGEGYGGYCVPKDGLFLEFVLTLSQAEKLRQIGLPEADHQAVAAFATVLLDRRTEFAGQFEWERWAAEQLQRQDCLRPYFSVSRGLPVFQITRIAHVLEHLGKPPLRDPYRVASNLAANWGLHKMVSGGEQVNRFMPFFKCWLIRQALADAARRRAQASVPFENCVLVLTAEYKPDTQDARFSTGLRKFEILIGSGGHLLNALDLDGRIIAVLMNEGFDAVQQRGWAERMRELLGIGAEDTGADEQLRNLFPAFTPPAEIRMVSPTGLSVQDVLHYTGDTRLEALAGETHRALSALGLTAKEIEANLRTWGARLSRWDMRASLPIADFRQLRSTGLHALALATLGPERYYRYAVQGADLIDTGIPNRELLELLSDPAQLCRLMLEGNPNSALAIVDGAAGARHRAMNRDDVMLWFAAAERLGRESVYYCVGVGQQTVEDWRSEMRRRRHRAERLWQALKNHDEELARRVYAGIVDEMRRNNEIQSALHESDKLKRFGRGGERSRLFAEALSRLGGGMALAELNFAGFLALGGLYVFVGAEEREIRAAIDTFASALALWGGYASGSEEEVISVLLPTERFKEAVEIRREQGVESSNKAMEERPSVALETRRQLAARIDLARSLNRRYAAFTAVRSDGGRFNDSYRQAIALLGPGDRPVTEESFGAFLKTARNALIVLTKDFQNRENAETIQDMQGRLELLFSGRQIDAQVYRRIAGGYEDIGDFGRLAQQIREQAQHGKIDAAAKERGLRCIAQGAELFYILAAVDCTITFTRQEPAGIDVMALWRTLAGFFADTLNDHSYEYRPWVYSRGTGYADYRGDSLYRLAVQHHMWLYRYLRFVLTHYTELKDLPIQEQDLLLGNYLDGSKIAAIGAGADGEAETIWRAYGQMRELAFIRNDGFAIPEVFAEFAPDIIRDRDRVNHVIAAPVGRTHFSRMLCEGPTLARHLEAEGRRGGNIIITRKLDIVATPDYRQPLAFIGSGHLYLDAAAYEEALVRHKGYARQQASRAAARLHPKGIRVAARFTRPVLAALVYPFHGDPAYDQGKIEACGLPYTVQSLFHTWTTYDKAKYRDIFRDSGVEMPDEINWLADDTARIAEKSAVIDRLKNGFADKGFSGLLDFAKRHSRVMVKDAAESGGRNMQAFRLYRADGSPDREQIEKAVDFSYQISLQHNVCIQEVVVSSPEYWATEAFMDDFVHRQIVEWGSAVNRLRRPYTPIFGSHRIIVSTANPQAADGSEKWHISHWITLNSKQLISNVGRGGLLEQLLPAYIRPEHRQILFEKLAATGRRVMEALSRYELRSAAAYADDTGRVVGTDLMGVSYGLPRYMMLDFLLAPVFEQAGVPVAIEALFDDNGGRAGSRFILQQGHRRFPGTIADWRIVLIEPNIGVGLWDRVALREEYHELERARREAADPDWDRIGANARIVLKDLNSAGEAYLSALHANDNPFS